MRRTHNNPVSEHNIQNEIRGWCGSHGILCFRANVGTVRTFDGGVFSTGLPDGFPDLFALPGNGIIVFIECKTRYGKQREAQINFQKIIESKGYKYVLARSVDDVSCILLPVL